MDLVNKHQDQGRKRGIYKRGVDAELVFRPLDVYETGHVGRGAGDAEDEDAGKGET